MKRKTIMALTLFSLSLALSACDKCGEFHDLQIPGRPAACKDVTAR